MSENENKLQLSCMMDGELGSSQGGFLLRRLNHDSELAGHWGRYHLVRDVLRKNRVQASSDLSGRISQALVDDPAPTRSGLPGWAKPVAGVAVAATVAVAAFTTFYQAPIEATSVEPVASVAPPTSTAAYANVPTLPQRARVASGSVNDAAEDPRLQAYIVRHNQASMRRGQGLVPYVYMISTPSQGETVDSASDTDRDTSD